MTENLAINELKEAIDCCKSGEDEHFKEALGMGILALEEIQRYRAIGIVEEFKTLKEKNKPKKPIRKPNIDWTHEEIICPTCESYISEYTNRKYCNCGQAITWER
jgi:hypothetical protein